MKKEQKKKWLFWLYIAAILLIGALLYPIFASLASEEGILSLKEKVQNLGGLGIFLVLAIQILQIVVAFIPGEVVEFASGAMYGTLGGLVLDLVGVAIGETLIYFLIARLGENVAAKIMGSEKIQKLKFLKNERKIELLLFFLFFIPGTPKDAICYVAPLFKIPYKPFILISVFARIPSIVSSTYAGATFSKGNIWETILIYGVIAVVSIAGILLNQAIMKRREKHGTDN